MGGVLPSLQSVSDTDRNAFLTVLVIPSTVIYLVMPLSYLVWFLLKNKLKWRLNMSVLSYFKMKPCRAISTIDSPKLDQYRRRDFRTFWFQICWLGIKKVDGCAERHLCGIDSLSLSHPFSFLKCGSAWPVMREAFLSLSANGGSGVDAPSRSTSTTAHTEHLFPGMETPKTNRLFGKSLSFPLKKAIRIERKTRKNISSSASGFHHSENLTGICDPKNELDNSKFRILLKWLGPVNRF